MHIFEKIVKTFAKNFTNPLTKRVNMRIMEDNQEKER